MWSKEGKGIYFSSFREKRQTKLARLRNSMLKFLSVTLLAPFAKYKKDFLNCQTQICVLCVDRRKVLDYDILSRCKGC
jgi:hypothetical protein